MTPSAASALASAALLLFANASAPTPSPMPARTVLDDWKSVPPPLAPDLEKTIVDSSDDAR